MSENIYNVFLFFENEICSAIGYVVHSYDGSDLDGCEYLQKNLQKDFLAAKKFSLLKPFSRFEYNARCRLGEGHHLYEELFVSLGAEISPLFIATPVKDGDIYFNCSSRHDDLDINAISAMQGIKGVMTDWLVKYTGENGIDISQLVHDDYFLAIKLTFNAKLYVSSMKLLVCCIDSIAYIEYGNDRQSTPFIKWLDAYANLSALGITAAELWEMRNGILHMTNINSTKVRNNKVRRITFRVGGPDDYPREAADGVYYFDFYGLIQEFAQALGRWIETYNNDHNKFIKFIERYDETISDSRVAITTVTV